MEKGTCSRGAAGKTDGKLSEKGIEKDDAVGNAKTGREPSRRENCGQGNKERE